MGSSEMVNAEPVRPDGRTACWAALSFLSALLFVGVVVQPAAIYYGFGRTADFPLFETSTEFFVRTALQPAGTVLYVSSALSQFYALNWAGTFVALAVAAVVCLLTWAVAALIVRRVHPLIGLLPLPLFLLVYARYGNAMAAMLTFGVALAGTAVYGLLRPRCSALAAALFALLGTVTYLLAADAALILAFGCGMLEVSRRRWELALPYVGVAVAFYFAAGLRVFRVPLPPFTVYPRLMVGFPDERYKMQDVLHVAMLVACLVLLLGVAVRSLMPGRTEDRPRRSIDRRVAALAPLLLIVAAFLLLMRFHDADFGRQLKIERYAVEGRWERLLAQARGLPLSGCDPTVCWYVNRALYETGRLPDRMFAYPQDLNGLLPVVEPSLDKVAGCVRFMKYSELTFALGALNMSERSAFEALETLGRHPLILRRLVMLHLAKERFAAAEIFLNLLSRDLILGRWARTGKAGLADGQPPALPAVARARALAMRQDRAVRQWPEDSMLKALLEKDPQNRMAFEYLMAHYMLKKELDGVAENIHRADAFGYPSLPRHYEEALLLWIDRGGETDVEISAECRERYEGFKAAIARAGRDMQPADAARPEYRDTYWFYHKFGRRGWQK